MTTSLADIIETCELAALRMALEPCPPPHAWTPEQDAALVAMQAAGMTADAIATEIAIPADAIQARLTWLTLPKPHGRSA